MVTRPSSLNSNKGPISLWAKLSRSRKTFIVSSILLGFLSLSVTSFLGYDSGYQIGFTYFPLVIGALSFAILLIATVLSAKPIGAQTATRITFWLGSAWMLFTIPLSVDYLIVIDPLEVVVMGLFVIVGSSYWRGNRNSAIGLLLAPFLAAFVSLDARGHFSGSLCGPSGLDSCGVLGISDIYLLMMLITLIYATVEARDRKPGKLLLFFAFAIPIGTVVFFTWGSLSSTS